MKKTLRDYQQVANNQAIEHCKKSRDPFLMVLSVGSGKTLMIADLAKNTVSKGGTVLCLSHQAELTKQNSDEAWDYGLPNSIFAASLGMKGVKINPIFAMRQTLVNALDSPPFINMKVDLIIVDEVHTFDFQNEESGAGKILKHFRDINPKIRIIGLTGTPYRNNEHLYQNGFWTAKTEKDITLKHQIEQGWIIDFHYGLHDEKEGMDFSGLDMRKSEETGGNYSEEDFDRILQGEYLKTMEICHNVHTKAQTIKGGCLIFCGSKLHTEQVKLGLLNAGAKPEQIAVVTDNTSPSDREAALKGSQDGSIKYFVNVGVASTGWNCPRWEYLVYMRPIASRTFFEQSLGRVLRARLDKKEAALFNGPESTQELRLETIRNSEKQFAIVDDYAGVVERLGDTLEDYEQIVQAVDEQQKHKNDYTTCPSCESENMVVNDLIVSCQDCGSQFELKKPELKECGLCGHQNSKYAIRCSNFYHQKNKDGREENLRCLGFFIGGEKYECKTTGCVDTLPNGQKIPTINAPTAKQCRNCGCMLSDPNSPLDGKAYRDNEYRQVDKMTLELSKNKKGVIVKFHLKEPDRELGVPYLYFHLDGSDLCKRIWYNEFCKIYVNSGPWQMRARNMGATAVIKAAAMFNTPTHITVRKNDKGKFIIARRLFRSGREVSDESQNQESA